MNYEEYKSLQEEHLITSDDLENKEDRTLIYGYTSDRKTFVIYLLDGNIVKRIGKEQINVSQNADYIPNKRVYPDLSDFEFCVLLMEKGYSIPFTSFAQT